MSKKADISSYIGLIKNNHTVIGDAGVNERKQSQILIQCNFCGKEKVIKFSHFNIGHIGECDCQKIGKYIGKIILDYKVIREVTKKELLINNRPTVEMQCIYCGKIIYVERYKLKSESIPKCKCMSSKAIKMLPKSKIEKVNLSKTEDNLEGIFLNSLYSSCNYTDEISYVGKPPITHTGDKEKVWCKCIKCNKYDLVYKDDFDNKLLFCDCTDNFDKIEKYLTVPQTIYKICEPYITYSNELIGQVFGTDKLINKYANICKVECIFCGKQRNVNLYEYLNVDRRTFTYVKCSCQLTQGDLLAKQNNYIGCLFGQLLVLNASKDSYLVKCCGCQKEFEISKRRLSAGVRSCGSISCKEVMNKYADIKYLNYSFNHLRVKYFLYKDTKQKVYWYCICDLCGNYIILSAENAMTGRIHTCGCDRIKNFTNYNIGDYIDNIEILDMFYKSNSGTYWVCKCPYCNDRYVRKPSEILSLTAKSCGCLFKSQVEAKVELILNNLKSKNDFYFNREVTFDNLIGINGGKLRFDFVLYKNNKIYCIIEFDGEQHYKQDKQIRMDNAEESFKMIQEHDKRKNQFCLENNIPLLRIKYTLNTSEIENIINKFILSLGGN